MSIAEQFAKFSPLSDYRGFVSTTFDGNDWMEVDLPWIQENIGDLPADFCDIYIRRKDDIFTDLATSFDGNELLNKFKIANIKLIESINSTYKQETIAKLHGHYLACVEAGVKVEAKVSSLHGLTECFRKEPFDGKAVILSDEELTKTIAELKDQTLPNHDIVPSTKDNLKTAIESGNVKSIEEGMKYVRSNILSWYVDWHEQQNGSAPIAYGLEAYDYVQKEIARTKLLTDTFVNLSERFSRVALDI